MRAHWKGTLVFGRIAIPIGLASTHVEGDVSFRTLHEECKTPISMRMWCPRCDRALEADELVKAWVPTEGQFVVVSSDELSAIAPDGSAKAIELFSFVPAAELDPIALAKAYYLTPAEAQVGRRPYVLLSRALQEVEMVGLARFVAWDSEHLAAVRPCGARALALHLLHLPEDRVAKDEIEKTLAAVDVDEGDVHLARELVMKLFDDLGSVDLASRQRPRVDELLQAKLAGREIVRPDLPADEAEQVPLVEADLSGALKKSIREARRPRRRRKAAAKAR